jgi:hypothetical protein
MTPEQQLMAKVKTVCGPWIQVFSAPASIYPEAFLAALTANESGGDPTKTRLEPVDLAELAQVLIGHKANFGSIGAQDLGGYLSVGDAKGIVQQLVNLATSWGPTQIMGYQALAGKYSLAELPNLQTHYRHATSVLDDFGRRFGLTEHTWPDVAWQYFRCWNTGHPNGTTADPAYVTNGLARMTIYGKL